MPYLLKSVTIRTNNTPEGMKQINAVWADIFSGKLPLRFDSAGQPQKDISPISKYSDYESDESGDYDLTIMGAAPSFFEGMEESLSLGSYKKYREEGRDLPACIQLAWEKVWRDQKDGLIQRTFSADYESSTPGEYTKDGQAHCCLYIAVNPR